MTEANEKIPLESFVLDETCKDYVKPQSEDLEYFDTPAMQTGLNANVNIITHLNNNSIFFRCMASYHF